MAWRSSTPPLLPVDASTTRQVLLPRPQGRPLGCVHVPHDPQSRTILLACKLPGHNNIISCIVNRDSLVEGAASHIKDQAKANFGIELPPVENIRLSTTTRFGYAIPLGRNETVGNYFPAFDGEVLVTTSGNGNAASPKKRKRNKSTASVVNAGTANRIAQPAKPSPQSPKKKKQKKKKKPAAAASKNRRSPPRSLMLTLRSRRDRLSARKPNRRLEVPRQKAKVPRATRKEGAVRQSQMLKQTWARPKASRHRARRSPGNRRNQKTRMPRRSRWPRLYDSGRQ